VTKLERDIADGLKAMGKDALDAVRALPKKKDNEFAETKLLVLWKTAGKLEKLLREGANEKD
jgi:hypothetical protein